MSAPGDGGEVVLRFDDVSLRADDGHPVWEHVRLDVRRGEFVAILGPNGSGKSSLIKVALGLIAPTSGRVEVLGGAPGAASARIGMTVTPDARSTSGATARAAARSAATSTRACCPPVTAAAMPPPLEPHPAPLRR